MQNGRTVYHPVFRNNCINYHPPCQECATKIYPTIYHYHRKCNLTPTCYHRILQNAVVRNLFIIRYDAEQIFTSDQMFRYGGNNRQIKLRYEISCKNKPHNPIFEHGFWGVAPEFLYLNSVTKRSNHSVTEFSFTPTKLW